MVALNEFKECQYFIAKFHEVGNIFNKKSKNTVRFMTSKKHLEIVPTKSISVDLKKTRVSAVRTLVNDFMGIKLGLQYYLIKYEITEQNWPTIMDWTEV